MRKVAIAGILAYNPDILLLDEPTRGLDPLGAKEIMDFFILLYLYIIKRHYNPPPKPGGGTIKVISNHSNPEDSLSQKESSRR